jgi:hypothetical protein
MVKKVGHVPVGFVISAIFSPKKFINCTFSGAPRQKKVGIKLFANHEFENLAKIFQFKTVLLHHIRFLVQTHSHTRLTIN